MLDEQRWQKKPKTNKGRIWVKNWISSRTKLGAYHTLLKKLASEDISAYKNYLRMDATTFEELLQKVAPIISKQDTQMRDAITAGKRLAVTLRYLASGKMFII